MFWVFGHKACVILAPDQGSNLHTLHWEVKSQPLDLQEHP